MDIIEIVLVVLMVVAAAVLTYAVLRQSSKSQGLSGAISGGSSDTYYGSGKGKDKDALWNKVTIVLAVFFVIVSLVFFIVNPTKAKTDTGNPDDFYGIPEQTTTVATTTTEAATTTEATTTTEAATTTEATTTTEAPAADETPNE